MTGQSSVRTGKTAWPRSPPPLWGALDGSESCEASPSPGPRPADLWVLQGFGAVEAGLGFQLQNLMRAEGCIHPRRPAEGRLCTGSAAYLNKETDMLVNAAQRWHTNDKRMLIYRELRNNYLCLQNQTSICWLWWCSLLFQFPVKGFKQNVRKALSKIWQHRIKFNRSWNVTL